MVGRKPKPTQLKVINGNPGHRALNEAEPKPVGELYEAPEWMTETQRIGWAYALQNAPLGLLKRLDRSLLSVWVVAEDLHREAAEKIAKFGMINKAPNTGIPMQSPFLPILNKQAMIMMKAASELGFTPSSRSRIVAPGAEKSGNRFANNGRPRA